MNTQIKQPYRAPKAEKLLFHNRCKLLASVSTEAALEEWELGEEL